MKDFPERSHKGPQGGPKGAKGGPKAAQRESKAPQREPEAGQREPKRPPSRHNYINKLPINRPSGRYVSRILV